jgi:hypothetical protein
MAILSQRFTLYAPPKNGEKINALMKRQLIWLSVLALLAFGLDAGAQSYAIDWSAIPGGGGTSSNAPYSLVGSIGQVGAGSVMSGGNYSLTGGFWSLISVVQTSGAPILSITHSANQVVISWPTPSSSWTVQQNANLAATGGWVTSGYPVTTNNGVVSFTITGPTGNLFFRLSQP